MKYVRSLLCLPLGDCLVALLHDTKGKRPGLWFGDLPMCHAMGDHVELIGEVGVRCLL